MLTGVVQFTPAFGRVEENVARACGLVRRHRADLLVLPELLTTGYRFRDRAEAVALAEPVPDGPSARAFLDLARELSCHLAFGIAERDGDRLYNSAALVGPEGLLFVYRKSHLFMDEKRVFDAGNDRPAVTDLAGGAARVGMLICFDYMFPEVARVLALQGAEILLHPCNLVTPYGQRTMETRSLENGVFTLLANRTGEEARGDEAPLRFSGRSRILGTRGEILAELDGTEEGAALAEIDPARARDKAVTPGNDLFKDRRPELYGLLTDRPGGDEE